jgi:DNA polymerase III epsilon subunit-like protein
MKKYIILDTETTNDIECPIVYDFGFSVIDESGKAYASYSFVNADVFCDDELMATAYFSDKIPQYWDDIKSGKRVLKSFRSIERIFRRVCRDWDIDTFVAHNARFDYLALQTTKRYITTSKERFFFPYGSKFVDTLKLSREVFGQNETYRNFCVSNNYVTKFGQNRYTAEIIYRFLTGNNNFEEEHTGLADCMIEKEIFRHCLETTLAENGYLW